MGSWDVSPFGNDEAREWLSALIAGASTEPVFRALVTAAKVRDGEFLPSQECERAIAAAEIVCCVRNKPTAEVPEELKSWLSQHKLVAGDQIAAMAVRVLGRITRDSELKQVFDDTDSAEEWYAALHDIQKRLQQSSLPQGSQGLPEVPESEAKLCEQAAVLVSEQKYEQALEKYDLAAETYSTSQMVFMGRAICHLWLGHYDKVIEDINKALSLDKPIADAYQLRSQAFFHQGKYRQVVADLTNYLSVRPHHIESYFIRGLSYEKLKQYENAINDFTVVIEKNYADNLSESLNHRAACYEVFGRGDLGAWDRQRAAQIAGAAVHRPT